MPDQVSLFYNSLTPVERSHMLYACCFELSKCDDAGVRQRMVHLWNEMDHDFAVKLAQHIDADLPDEPAHKNHGKRSAYLSMIDSPYSTFDSAATRNVAVIVADGYNASHLLALKKAMLAEGAELCPVGPRKGKIWAEGHEPDSSGATASSKTSSKSEKGPEDEKLDPSPNQAWASFTLYNSKSVMFDGVIVLGGRHVSALKQIGEATAFINEALKHCKVVACIGEAIQLLKPTAALTGIKLANEGDSNSLCTDQAVITVGSMDVSSQGEFCDAFIDALRKHRYWERVGVDKIPA